MSPRRDPEGRLPKGSGLGICLLGAAVFWLMVAELVVSSIISADPGHDIATSEARHADR